MQNKHQSIQIFKNPLLEKLTHVHPITPLVLWVPIISYFLYQSISVFGNTARELVVIFAAGMIVWTLTEYTLHRFLFHFESENPIAKRLVFLFHGLHHDDPVDPTRLVMPPVPALLISSGLYALFSLVVPKEYLSAFFAFFMVGYLCYDYIHYGTHHFKMKNRVAAFLKKNHLLHHYKNSHGYFGVSSPLWDYVFRTYRDGEKH